jgi:hypothetical protein
MRHRRNQQQRRPGKQKATLFIKGEWVHVRTPYHEGFVNALKAEIEYSYRKWGPAVGIDDKVWLVDPSQIDTLVFVCERFFEVNVVEDKTEVIMVEGEAAQDAYSRMMRMASPGLKKKIYRLIAMEVHPDKGGTPAQMTELNLAWEEIKKEL